MIGASPYDDLMTRISSAQGWLLYANPEIAKGMVVSGDVMIFELAVDRSAWGSSLRVTCDLAAPVLRQGVPLESMMWEALQSWPGDKQGRKWPPEMLALLALARNHPEEYERLRDGEAVLRALGGL